MSNKTVAVRLTNAMRHEIHDKVLKKTFESRVDRINKELKDYAQELTKKGHVEFFKAQGNPVLAQYLASSNDAEFTYHVDDKEAKKIAHTQIAKVVFRKSCKNDDLPIHTFCVGKHHTSWNGGECIRVAGPVKDIYSGKIMSVSITKQQLGKINRLADDRDELVQVAKKFSEDLIAALYGAKTLVELYHAMPALKGAVGREEIKVVEPVTALVVSSAVLTRELKIAGLVAA